MCAAGVVVDPLDAVLMVDGAVVVAELPLLVALRHPLVGPAAVGGRDPVEAGLVHPGVERHGEDDALRAGGQLARQRLHAVVGGDVAVDEAGRRGDLPAVVAAARHRAARQPGRHRRDVALVLADRLVAAERLCERRDAEGTRLCHARRAGLVVEVGVDRGALRAGEQGGAVVVALGVALSGRRQRGIDRPPRDAGAIRLPGDPAGVALDAAGHVLGRSDLRSLVRQDQPAVDELPVAAAAAAVVERGRRRLLEACLRVRLRLLFDPAVRSATRTAPISVVIAAGPAAAHQLAATCREQAGEKESEAGAGEHERDGEHAACPAPSPTTCVATY